MLSYYVAIICSETAALICYKKFRHKNENLAVKIQKRIDLNNSKNVSTLQRIQAEMSAAEAIVGANLLILGIILFFSIGNAICSYKTWDTWFLAVLGICLIFLLVIVIINSKNCIFDAEKRTKLFVSICILLILVFVSGNFAVFSKVYIFSPLLKGSWIKSFNFYFIMFYLSIIFCKWHDRLNDLANKILDNSKENDD
jgi:membrane-associated HD superfamily phosphohydrolase